VTQRGAHCAADDSHDFVRVTAPRDDDATPLRHEALEIRVSLEPEDAMTRVVLEPTRER
jgi:hypothetical protein